MGPHLGFWFNNQRMSLKIVQAVKTQNMTYWDKNMHLLPSGQLLLKIHQFDIKFNIKKRQNQTDIKNLTWNRSDVNWMSNILAYVYIKPISVWDNNLFSPNYHWKYIIDLFQCFPATFLEPPNIAHFASLLCLTHPFQVVKSLLMSWWLESVFD